MAPSLLYFKLTKTRVRGYGLVSQKDEALRIKTTNEMVGGIRDIRLLDKGAFLIDQFNTYDSLVATANFKNSFISQ